MSELTEAAYSQAGTPGETLKQATDWRNFASSVVTIIGNADLHRLARESRLPRLGPFFAQFAAVAVVAIVIANFIGNHVLSGALDSLSSDLVKMAVQSSQRGQDDYARAYLVPAWALERQRASEDRFIDLELQGREYSVLLGLAISSWLFAFVLSASKKSVPHREASAAYGYVVIALTAIFVLPASLAATAMSDWQYYQETLIQLALYALHQVRDNVFLEEKLSVYASNHTAQRVANVAW